MISYSDWLMEEGKVKMYELYILGPGINPISDKIKHTVKEFIKNPESCLVLKFRGTKEDVSKAEKALAAANFRVIETEIEHD